MSTVSEFVYRIPGKPGSSRPGAHRSKTRGPGLAFSHYARLLDQPDPRRLDLRASIRNVNRDWLVRATRQHSATIVQVMVDVSPSMQFGIPHSKLDVAADFVEALGYSAFGYGDALGMVAFDHHIRDELTTPARTGRAVGTLMADSLRHCRSSGESRAPFPPITEETLLESAFRIGHGTSLLFLVSDFHWPLHLLETVLEQLSHMMLVPIVIWNRNETRPPRPGRWLRTRDVESGVQHNLLMRAATVKRWQDNITRRRTEITRVFGAHQMTPVFMEDGFDAEQLSRHFMESTS